MSKIDFINVGYGDSVLLQSAGCYALIDCGDICSRVIPGKGERITASEFLSEQGIDTLDLLWITHLHLDHVGGLETLSRDIKVKKIVVPYLPEKRLLNAAAPFPDNASDGVVCLIKAINIFNQALNTFLNDGTEVILCNPLEKQIAEIEIGEYHLNPFYIDNPNGFLFMKRCFDDALNGKPSETDLLSLDGTINSYSIGLHVQIGSKLIELPGDLDLASCKALLCKPCEIFKMPHHGHSKSVDEELMQCIKPKHTVISVSDDRTDPCPNETSIQMALPYGDVSFTDAVVYNGNSFFHQSVHFSIK